MSRRRLRVSSAVFFLSAPKLPPAVNQAQHLRMSGRVVQKHAPAVSKHSAQLRRRPVVAPVRPLLPALPFARSPTTRRWAALGPGPRISHAHLSATQECAEGLRGPPGSLAWSALVLPERRAGTSRSRPSSTRCSRLPRSACPCASRRCLSWTLPHPCFAQTLSQLRHAPMNALTHTCTACVRMQAHVSLGQASKIKPRTS